MKKLHFYILKEFLASFLIGLFVFTFMFLIFQMMELLELIVSKGVPLNDVLKLYIYILPSFLAITIPMAVLTGVLMTYGKMAQNNEITALKSAGISLKKIINPLLFISVIISLFMVMFNDKVLPWGNINFRSLYFKIVYERVQVAMKEKVFISDFPDHILYMEHLIPKTSNFEDIKIIKLKDGKAVSAIFAKSGELISNQNDMQIMLKLIDGNIHQFSEKEIERHYNVKFKQYWIALSIRQSITSKISSNSGNGDMSLKELDKAIQKSKNMEKNILLVEFHKKISIPFACLTFTLIGAPLGVLVRRSGKSVGFGLSLILIVIYYTILITGIGLGERGQLPAWFAIWAPNIILSTIGAIFLTMASKDIGFFSGK